MSVGTPDTALDLDPLGGPGGPDQPGDITARSPLELFWRRLRRDKVSLVALFIISIVLLDAIFAPLIVKIVGTPGPQVANLDKYSNDFGQPLGPGSGHPFGIDRYGRDVFTWTVYGARVSMESALLSTFLILVIGVTVGMVAGYYRGWVDSALSRGMDILLAFPVLVLAIGIGVACATGCLNIGGHSLIQPGLSIIVFIIVLTTWPYMARIIRGQVLSIREKEYVEAARSLGASDTRILFRHILPNLIAPIVVYGTVLIPTNILYEAALSFLGVGVNSDTPSWGSMLSDATGVFKTEWWFMLAPGVALLVTVLAFNIVGDGLQDALNPRTSK